MLCIEEVVQLEFESINKVPGECELPTVKTAHQLRIFLQVSCLTYVSPHENQCRLGCSILGPCMPMMMIQSSVLYMSSSTPHRYITRMSLSLGLSFSRLIRMVPSCKVHLWWVACLSLWNGCSIFRVVKQHGELCPHRWPAGPQLQVLGPVWHPLFLSGRLPVPHQREGLVGGYDGCLGWMVSSWGHYHILLLLLIKRQPWVHGWIWQKHAKKEV